jgi:hypothetical protein
MAMWNSRILQLLSQHRQSGQPAFPAALSMTQITSLLRQCLDPNQPIDQLGFEVQESLRKLEAQNEILKASGNRYCIAPPTLLAANQESLVGLLFRGDRAYLKLAHEILKTKQPITEERLRSSLRNFERAKARLRENRIGLMTLEEIINELPKPQKPQRFLLQEHRSSLTTSEFWQISDVKQYIPAYAEQQDRWRSPTPGTLKDESLLQLPGDQYLWFEDGQFHEIGSDTAILTMFYLDQRDHQPIRFVLEDTGRLNLQSILLPYAHFQWFKQLVERVDGQSRVYYVPPAKRPLVHAVFRYLGCDLR